ncbi:MAG: polyprenyl synthetase family protein [Nitrososphaerales archaeon]
MEIQEELMRDLERRSAPYLERINGALNKVLTNHKTSNFFEPLSYATNGGKRIRPLLLMLSAEGVGLRDNSNKKTELASIAIELLHTESIIHDDIIDEQTARRDRVAFHVKYGYGTAILTADFVFGIILEIASVYNDVRVSKELSVAALTMCEGELREVRLGQEIKKLSWQSYVQVITEKTAALFRTATRLGSIIGGGNEEEIQALSNYGVNLGVAYQIQDDILDWGEDEKLTKASMKSTDKDAVPHDINISKLKEMAEVYSRKAKRELEIIKTNPARDFLHYLADFTVLRDY